MLTFVDPTKEVNVGLWCLFGGASVFLGLRIWVKFTRLQGLWYDDYILVASWVWLSSLAPSIYTSVDGSANALLTSFSHTGGPFSK